ncbi:MAG TPA: type II secretion system secretin GspD [Bryobacteraceae bacterium]|nr:type II secretion system secretin GspD [Bryobacteraceae bacterium]
MTVAACLQAQPTPNPAPQQQQQQQQPPAAGAPAAQPPAAPAQQPPAAPAQQPPVTLPPSPTTGGLNLQNASLVEVIDILARQLKINYILDPRVKGAVTINTYGETKNLDNRALLDLILRINGAAMIQVGEIYRIVPLPDVKSLPLPPQVNAKEIPEDDRTMLNLIFLKYATVQDLAQLVTPFLGEGATTVAYPPANLLLVQDSRRNMRRLMELISLFDSNEFAAQRVRLFEVSEGRPSDIAKELESVLKAISLNDKSAPIKFLPIDRINTIVAIAPNPGAFDEIEKWIRKLDVPIQITAGSIDNYVYRVKYGRAETLAGAIMLLYGGYGGGGYGYGGFGQGGMFGAGSYGAGMYPGGYGAGYPGGGGYGSPYGYGAGYPGGYPVGGYPGGGYPGGGYPGGFPGGGYGAPVYTPAPSAGNGAPAGTTGTTGTTSGTADQTGQYLTGGMGYGAGMRIPRIVPNPLDNSLLIQGTPQEYAGILKLLRELDVPPRQVLIEAKIYEVDLSHGFQSGVAATLRQRGTGAEATQLDTRKLSASLLSGFTNLSIGALVGQTREMAVFLASSEGTGRSKVLSAPSLIATDSIPASITVGSEVPTLTSSAATGVQQGGTSVFANNVSSRSTGVTLNVLARVNPSGIVTLVINQEVTAAVPTLTSDIDSPSFSKRSVQTQVTVQDGDTIAIGGIINEDASFSSNGVPVLNRIPLLGGAFGNRTYSKSRTELIVLMTPRVIYDTNEISEASDELRSRVRRLRRVIPREDQQ